MERVSLDDVDPTPTDPDLDCDRRSLTEPLGTTDVAITHYVLAPGERFSGSVHAHVDQEEVFVVLRGEATFETRRPDEETTREVTVGPGEAVRFEPGEFQTGWNAGTEPVVALALGAPRDSEDVRLDRIVVRGDDDGDLGCPDCGHDHLRIARDATGELVCPACGTGVDGP